MVNVKKIMTSYLYNGIFDTYLWRHTVPMAIIGLLSIIFSHLLLVVTKFQVS